MCVVATNNCYAQHCAGFNVRGKRAALVKASPKVAHGETVRAVPLKFKQISTKLVN
jgi:hypothetical protein